MGKPRFLYHDSRPSRRQSIAEHGLDPTYGAKRKRGCGQQLVFMTSELGDCSPCTDIWRIDTRGLRVEQHHGEETWWISRTLIPPAKLKLVRTVD